MSDTFSISELAREFAITTRAIRFYEDKQLLKPERVGNSRVYSRTDRTRLKLVLRGKRLGWPLDDIKRMIEMYDVHAGHGERLQLEAMVTRLQQTRELLLAQQQDLLETLDEIEELENTCCEQLAKSCTTHKRIEAGVETGAETNNAENRLKPGTGNPQPPDSPANADLYQENAK